MLSPLQPVVCVRFSICGVRCHVVICHRYVPPPAFNFSVLRSGGSRWSTVSPPFRPARSTRPRLRTSPPTLVRTGLIRSIDLALTRLCCVLEFAARFAFCKQDATLVESKVRFRKLGSSAAP
jgi:hypothetical protein